MRTSLWFRLCLMAFVLFSFSAAVRAQVVVSVGFAPPELPVYEQPICPGDGYIWTPGYWAWNGFDYYWVPGTWVLAPEVGFFWTPPYWGWGGAAFVFHAGYWGPVVGFYGGINYGFGYFGHGFEGGRWDGGHFFYNRAVTNINVTVIHNVYNTRVNNVTVNRVSYNGGQGGIVTRPTAQEEAAEHDRHLPPVAAQNQHMDEARNNEQLRASVNHGRPPIAATAKPSEFHGGTTGATSEGRYTPPARGSENAPAAHNPTVHPNDLQPHEHLPAPNTGNTKLDQKYQKEQDKLYAKQQQDHQKLQQQQEKEHQQAEKHNASEAQKQQMEQRHQQQTQQMEQKHAQQTQHMVEHQQAHSGGGKPR